MEKDDLINHYFEGNLTAKERVIFDKLMDTDPEFVDAIAYEKKVKVAITLENRKNLKAKLVGFENNKSEKNFNKQWVYIAASVVVLFGISLFFFNQTPTNDKLFATYFEPYPNTIAPIVRSNVQKTTKHDAFSAYESGDYQKSSQLFGALIESSGEEYALFYQSMSYLMLNDVPQASNILSKSNWTDAYKEKANWYLALCYIKQNNSKEAKTLLHSLVSENSFNHEKARELLRQLK